MRRSHMTARYVSAKIADLWFRWRHPDAPWLTPEAIRLLARRLTPQDTVLEWGSGRSTIWFARRCRHVTSVEHDTAFHGRLSQQLGTLELRNVTYLRRDCLPGSTPSEVPDPYVSVARDMAASSIDIALVDGKRRVACALAAVPVLRPGGWLVVDNVETIALQREFALLRAVLSRWTHISTVTGMTETHIWKKPL